MKRTKPDEMEPDHKPTSAQERDTEDPKFDDGDMLVGRPHATEPDEEDEDTEIDDDDDELEDDDDLMEPPPRLA